MKSLTGRNETEQLYKQKINYIKTLVQSRVPNKSNAEFETQKWCHGSLSKSCLASTLTMSPCYRGGQSSPLLLHAHLLHCMSMDFICHLSMC